MADIFGKLKRGGDEIDQESAKTDGMSKGGKTGMGSGAHLESHGKRGGKEYAQESAKTDGMCK